jgi:hypothetical protein
MEHVTRSFSDRHFDQLVRPELRLFSRPLPAFQVCGYTGFLLGFMQSMILVQHLGLSELTILGITGTVILTFYTLMMATKILAGGELIIYYHHEIAVVAMTALFLRLIRQPVLPYLDIAVLGVGLFLTCGRIGCLMVGCCHGRPCHWGIKYGDEHARAGFPDYLVGVRLFPIQALESVLALCIVACGTVLVLKQYPPGSALVFYIVSYGWGRFCMEFARGDTARRYLLGFSEAQWTSLLLALAVMGAERARILPVSRWHWTAALGMAAAMVLISIGRRFDGSHRFELLHPRHLREVIGALDHLEGLLRWADGQLKLNNPAAIIHVARTSLGYRISAGETAATSHAIKHYSVSHENGSLSAGAARTLARLIAHRQPSSSSFAIVERGAGVLHILFDPSPAPPRMHPAQSNMLHDITVAYYRRRQSNGG